MPAIIMGMFFILHGLVHLLYVGQSGRLFELRPNIVFATENANWKSLYTIGSVSALLRLGLSGSKE